MVIGTLTTGDTVVTVINLTYLPEYITYEAATQLTALKVEVLGEDAPILDLDAVGLSTIGRSGMYSRKTNGYAIPLANGLIKGKNVVMTFTNSAAQTPAIRAWSDSVGDSYVKSFRQKTFAASGIDVPGTAFGFISFSNGTAATDELNISVGGVTQKFNLIDLQVRNSMMYDIDNAVADYYLLQDGSVENVNYVPSSDTVLYFQKSVRA